MLYRLIASDLDGTLLDQHHAVTAYTATTLQALEQRGVAIAIATGRHHVDVKNIRQELGVRAHLITSNGARVHDPDDQLIHRHDILPEVVRAISQPEFAAGSILNYYLDETWLIDQADPWTLRFHQDSPLQPIVRNLADHDGCGVAKVMYIGEHEHLLGVESLLRQRYGEQLYITFSLGNCLEVMAAGVSKGHALHCVLERLDIPAAACLAFGDGQNDIELLQAAGHPRMMANAHPFLAESLPNVPRIGSNSEAGVARHLRALFALGV